MKSYLDMYTGSVNRAECLLLMNKSEINLKLYTEMLTILSKGSWKSKLVFAWSVTISHDVKFYL